MAETREQRLARIKAEGDARRAAEEAANNKPSATSLVRKHSSEIAGSPGSGDVTHGATEEQISQFNQGNELMLLDTPPQPIPAPPKTRVIDWLPNELDKFDLFNYNISIFQVHPKHVGKMENLFKDKDAGNYMTLIADNKVSSIYNVNNVTMTNSVAMSTARSGLAIRFSINIVEPAGARFLESLAVVARELGIENHLQATYIIRIEFIGRDHQGRVLKHNPIFYYPVTFVSVEASVTEKGSEYNIEAVETHSGAYNYLESSLKSALVIEAETVGEYMSELEKRMNKVLGEEFASNINQLYVDEYKFEFRDEAEKWLEYKFEALTGADADGKYDSRESSESSIKSKNKLQFNLTHGSSVLSVIGSALYATREYKLLHTHDGNTVKATPEGQSQSKLDKFPVFFKVIPQVEYGDYDYLRGDYQKKYIYVVKPYIVPEIIVDAQQYHTSITSKDIQDKRIEELVKAELLRKRYDYIFTGKNRDIMKLDLQFNMAYYLISVIGNGSTGDPQKDAAVNSTRDAIDNKLIAAKRAYISAKREYDSARLKEEKINTSISNRKSNVLSDNPELAMVGHNNILYADVAATINQSLDKDTENYAKTRNDELADAKIAQVAAESDMMMARMDIDAAVAEIKKANDEYKRQDISAPIRFAGDVIDDAEIYGPESNKLGGTIQFGNVMANAENSADLLELDIVIRGDPYWLGSPKLKQPHPLLCDYEKGSPLFFLNVKFPVVGNPNESLVIPRDDYSVSGLYQVIEITHSFANGLFTQSMKTKRDTGTNTGTVKETLLTEARLIKPKSI